MFEGYELSNLTVRASDLPGGSGAARGGNFMTATVVESGGGQAVLNLDGKTVTVKTDAPLTPGSEYKVMVKGIAGGKVQLQIVSGAAASRSGAAVGGDIASTSTPRALTDADIPSRLIGFDLPEHAATARLARAVLSAGMPVTKDTMEALIRAAPQNITDRQIDYLISLTKAGIEPTREALNLMPALERELAALPRNMEAAFELVAKNPEFADKIAQLAAQTRDGSRLAQVDLRSLLLVPDTDALPQAADKLQALSRQFFTTSEARLMFLDALAANITSGAEPVESLIQRLSSLIQTIPQQNPGPNTALDQTIRSVMDFARSLPEPAEPRMAEAFNTVREDFIAKAEALFQAADTGAKYTQIRDLAVDSLNKLVQILNNAGETSENKFPPFQTLQQLPQRFENLLATIQNMAAQSAPDATPQFIARLAADLAPLLTMQFNTELFENTGRLIQNTVQMLADAAAGQAQKSDVQPANITQQELTARIQVLAEQAGSQAVRQEIDLLAAQLRDAGDLRSALMHLAQQATAAQDPASAAANLARNLQFATLANLIAHNGAAPTEAFVTFFPIQVGDRVEIGKLKVYKNHEGKSRRGGGKEVDPDNASLAIILDTEFLGLSLININTFERNLRCNIQVQHKRIKRILDKYLAELSQGLENTPYKLDQVSVTVQTRKQRKDAQEAMPETPRITTIDMKI